MSSIVSSEESRKDYIERKNSVLELLRSAEEYYESVEQNDKADTFKSLYDNLLNEEFSIVVVGEFSAGKSTLLNALMRKKILPSFSNETTATVNFLRHSGQAENGEAGKVFYTNGDNEILESAELDTIEKFVTTKGDEVAKKIDHLDLYLNSDFLKDGVTLVDSPGLNGIADGHREITEAQILKSHASIFLFNSDHPGSKTDFEFLHNLQNKVNTIIFVLNKIDAIKADEGESPETLIETLKKTYKDRFPEKTTIPEIWPVSAYQALVSRNDKPLEYNDKKERTAEENKKLERTSRMKEFEDRLMSFLTRGEKTKQQLLSPVEKVIALTKESRKEYEEDIEVLKKANDAEEIDEQMAKVKEEIEEIQKRISESRQSISSDINESLRDIREDLSAKMSRLQENKINEIDRFDDVDEISEYLSSFENKYKSRVHSIVIEQEDNLRDEIFNVARLHYSSQAELIKQNLFSEDSVIELVVSNHLDTSERVFEVGLKEMDEKVKALEDQLASLKNEADHLQDDYYRQRRIERNQDELKKEIKNLQDNKAVILEQFLPTIEKYTVEKTEKRYRGGILGGIGTLLFGRKDVTSYEICEDRTAYDEAKRNRDSESAYLEKEIEKKEAQLNDSGNVDSSLAELKHKRKLSEMNSIREELEELQKNNIEKINKNNKKIIRSIKNTLNDYCDDISDALGSQVKKLLRDSEQRYIDIVMNAVEGALKQELKNKQTRLEQLENQLQSSETEKKERIEGLEEKIKGISELMIKAVDRKAEIENIQADIIQQQEI